MDVIKDYFDHSKKIISKSGGSFIATFNISKRDQNGIRQHQQLISKIKKSQDMNSLDTHFMEQNNNVLPVSRNFSNLALYQTDQIIPTTRK